MDIYLNEVISLEVKKLKITVVGSGYVGMSLSVILSQNNSVTIFDIDKNRIDKVNKKESTIVDNDITKFMSEKNLDLKGSLDSELSFTNADFVIIATPTNFNEDTNEFDTDSVDSVISDVFKHNSKCTIIIKSTIPVGYTKKVNQFYKTDRIIFSPEFLREGLALHDNLFPSRIIVGSSCKAGKKFALIMEESAIQKKIPKLFVSSNEAESIKLFSNTYLAMRVAYFNELDSFAMKYDMDSKNIINGVSLDNRIGDGYNNPSFGYGGYCLPKDTKQLLSNFKQVPNSLIKAIVDSNETRKDFIANQILSYKPSRVGVFKLAMKKGSDNFRFSSILNIIDKIKINGIEVVIYEPSIKEDNYAGMTVVKNLENFKSMSDIILANRVEKSLDDVTYKCFSRDVFGDN